MAGYFDFTSGSVLTAAQIEDVELQTTMRFASAAARTTALSGVLTEGLRCYLIDLNVEQVYTGSAWSTIGPIHGALTSWTPTVTQSGSVTVTNTRSVYQRIGRLIHWEMKLTVTGSGTSANAIVIGGLPATAATSAVPCGSSGWVFDSSASTNFFGIPYLASTTTIQFVVETGTPSSFLGAAGFTSALASGDILLFQGFYEAASDA